MKKVLVVEDESAYLRLLHDQLTKSGYEVVDAMDGEAGLKVALAEKPDLILLDILMPKVSGLEMLKVLRADRWGKDVMVYILTNVDQSKEISESMDDNVSRYIVKSDWRLEDIINDVRQYLDRG